MCIRDRSYVKPILNFTLLTGLAPKLSNSALIIFLFGTVTTLLSNVLILVLLNPTFTTIPVTPPKVTISPTVKGLSKKIDLIFLNTLLQYRTQH